MADSGFEALDTMQIAKFAEGESFVLMQKIARDRVKNNAVIVGVEGTLQRESIPRAIYLPYNTLFDIPDYIHVTSLLLNTCIYMKCLYCMLNA